MKQQQALDREDNAGWRNLWMAKLQAKEKKMADDKRLAIKQMELNAQAQAGSSAAVDPPPRNRDAKSRS